MENAILLIEDEKNLHHTLKLNLELEGFIVDSAFTGDEGLYKILRGFYVAVILDLMLPNIDGISILEEVRIKKIETPILILSAKTEINQKIEGLKKGADDYLTKPFNFEELLIRIQKIMLRKTDISEKISTDFYSFKENKIFFDKLQVINFKNISYKITIKESIFLKLLIDEENKIVSREKISQLVWGYNVYNSYRTIDNFILNFRKYFEIDRKLPKHFISIRGIGYKFLS